MAIRDRYLKKEATDDDILDAIVLAYFAYRSLTLPLKAIPNPPQYDEKGLRMAIHWCRSSSGMGKGFQPNNQWRMTNDE